MGNRPIILSADSTCDLGTELEKEHNVESFPYHIVLDGNDYIDNISITTKELFQAYYDRKLLPKTSAINSVEFVDYFRPWVEQGYDVIHISLGSGLSCTYNNCCIAAEELGHVYPVDSYNLSTGAGLLVLRASELIKEGLSAAEVKEELLKIREKIHSSFILDTLTFMSAGGRCSSVTSFAATMLNLKPCIQVDNTSGCMSVGKKYRGRLGAVLDKFVEDTINSYKDDIDTSRIFITHSEIHKSYVEQVRNKINSMMHFDKIYETDASCTVSCHCGPNTLGIMLMTR